MFTQKVREFLVSYHHACLNLYSNLVTSSQPHKMSVKFNLIAAMCENRGIGTNGKLPWRLKEEMAYFTKMTTETEDPNKKNVVLMGRKSWDCIPLKFRPLKNRINVVLTRNPDFVTEDGVIFRNSLEAAIELFMEPEFRDKIETVWVIGGSHIYKETMESKYFYRLYLTEIMKHFDCDTFMPKLNPDLKLVSDPRVSTEINEENGIKFMYKIYENDKYK